MLRFVGKMALAGTLAGVLSAGAAMATPTCTTTQVLPSSGQTSIGIASFTSGYCVRINDKLFGNFNMGNLPADTTVQFNLNSINSFDYYQIAFSGGFKNNGGAGKHYDWSFDVAVTGAPPGTTIVELDTDFSQTAGGPSTLKQDLNGVLNAINETKNGATASGTLQALWTPGITDLTVALHLFDKGTISSVTDTIVQFIPIRNDAPEPLTLSLFGAGLAGLGFARRKRRN